MPRDSLGIEVVVDEEMVPQGRWFEVRPRDAQTSLMLDELRARGAATSDVIRVPWGTYATVDAHDGHTLQCTERPRS